MNIHETIVAAEAATCVLCGPGPCDCAPNIHLARIARARADELISTEDFVACIGDQACFSTGTVVIDPGAAA